MIKSIAVYSVATIILLLVTVGVCLVMPEKVNSSQRLVCAGLAIMIGLAIIFGGLVEDKSRIAVSGLTIFFAGIITIITNNISIETRVVVNGVVSIGILGAVGNGIYLIWAINEGENLGKAISGILKISFFFAATLVNFGILYHIPRLI